MLEAIVSGPELPVLDIADEVLREERVASPEAIREVDATAKAFLLGTREEVNRASDHGAIEVEAQHQVRREASGEAREIVASVRPDEVRDDVPSGPIAALKLRVIQRQGRGFRIFEP